MDFTQAPLRVQRGGPADRRRGLRRTRTRDAVAQPGPGRQPAVQGQPAIGAGDSMDADAVQAGERAYRRQQGPGRQRPPLDRPAHGRDHLFHQRRRGVAARAGTRSGFGHHARPVQLQFSRLYKRPGLACGVYFQTRRAYPEWAACRWSHALQHRFAGRAVNPDGSPHAPSRPALPTCIFPYRRHRAGRAASLDRRGARAAGSGAPGACRWPPQRPPRPRPRSGR